LPAEGWTEPYPGVHVWRKSGASAGPDVLLTAGIHGDEYEGPAAILEVIAFLESTPLCGSCTAIPVAHPAAWRAASRLSPVDGLNLARTFPGDPAAAGTKHLAAFLFQLASSASHLIDLHSGGSDYVFTPLAGFYDSPGRAAAAAFGLPALWLLPPTAGVLSYEFAQRGGIAIGCEYLGGGQLAMEGVRAYAEGIRNCLAQWGLTAEKRPPVPEAKAFSGDWTCATASGAFFSFVELNQTVGGGQPLAEIRDERGRVLETLVAASPGRVLARRSKGYINQGDWGVLVGTKL
jgi:predicted deacylase